MKEQETRLTLQEHDDDDDDNILHRSRLNLILYVIVILAT